VVVTEAEAGTKEEVAVSGIKAAVVLGVRRRAVVPRVGDKVQATEEDTVAVVIRVDTAALLEAQLLLLLLQDIKAKDGAGKEDGALNREVGKDRAFRPPRNHQPRVGIKRPKVGKAKVEDGAKAAPRQLPAEAAIGPLVVESCSYEKGISSIFNYNFVNSVPQLAIFLQLYLSSCCVRSRVSVSNYVRSRRQSERFV